MPGLYPAHSLAHSMEILSTRSRGVVSLVSTARLNISRRLRGAPSGSGLARTSVAPSANLNLVTVRKDSRRSYLGKSRGCFQPHSILISVVSPRLTVN